ncbi:MAG: HlyD family type I secretion periplasmic adaptor subunit [Pseudomonadota bacterium]
MSKLTPKPLLEHRSYGKFGYSHTLRLVVLMPALCVAAFLLWAASAELEEVAIAGGKVVPSSQVNTVQHLEGGIIDEILVKEGQVVEIDQPLVKLNGAIAESDLSSLRARRTALRLNIERLHALVEGNQPHFNAVTSGYDQLKEEQLKILDAQRSAIKSERSVLRQQLKKRKAELAALEIELENMRLRVGLLTQERDIRKKMYRAGVVPKIEMIQARHTLAREKGELNRLERQETNAKSEINVYANRLRELIDRSRNEAMREIGQLSSEITETSETIKALDDRVRRLMVRSPVRGVVQNLPIKTSSGILAPGAVVAEIVPLNDELRVEAEVTTRDIGFVRPGQDVQVKVESYHFARYGTVNGRLSAVSATTFVRDDGSSYYKVLIDLSQSFVGHRSANRNLVPGMTVTADIRTGSKTVLEYILKPIYTTLNESLRER